MEFAIKLSPEEAALLGTYLGAKDIGSLQAALQEQVKGQINKQAQVEAAKVQADISGALKTLDLETLRRVARAAGV